MIYCQRGSVTVCGWAVKSRDFYVRTDSLGRLELLRRALLEAEKQKSQTHNNKDAVMSSHSEEQQFLGFLGCYTVSEVE